MITRLAGLTRVVGRTAIPRAVAARTPVVRAASTLSKHASGAHSSMAVTDAEYETFWDQGWVMRRGMFDAAESALLQEAARTDTLLDDHAFRVADGQGGHADLTLWNHPGDDIYGAVMRSARIVRSAEKLLGEEVYHYHTKLMRKDPETGGAFPWHQDYGYWYQNGCLAPSMLTAFVAIDKCTVDNGCLQVITGSHKLGRLTHGRVGGQSGVGDMERIQAIRDRMKVEFLEMEPGDVALFHCNLLHRSKANRSQNPRWALLAAYNTASNDPIKTHHHPGYTPMTVCPDSTVKHLGVKRASDPSLFMDPTTDKTIDLEAGSGADGMTTGA